MKSTILAAVLAIAMAPASFTTPSFADSSVTVRFGDSGGYSRHDRGHHRGWYKNRDRRGWKSERRFSARDCVVKTERFWRHGKRVVQRTKVCD